MSIQITDGLRQLYFPRLNAVGRVASYGFRMWLQDDSKYIPTHYKSNNCLEIQLYDENSLLASLAKDIDRLSCASFETLSSIEESHPNKKYLAWQLVKTYYSAFYAAHSTLKICGLGLVQIDSNTLNHIKRRADSLGIETQQMKAGMYCVEFDQHISKAHIYNVPRYDDSHRGLWQRYIDFLKVLCGTHIQTGETDSNCIRLKNAVETASQSVYAQLSLDDANAIATRLEGLRKVIDKKGDGNWLSFVRNEINYNQAFGVWHPYSQYLSEYNSLLPSRDLYLSDPLDGCFCFDDDYELMRFYKSCHLVSAINREILIDLGSRHPKNKSFLDTGALYLLRTR